MKILRKVKGKKSTFFEDPAIDQVMTFVVELLAEVSVLRDRVDTLEQLLDERGVVGREAVESYVHDAESEQRRMAARKALLERVLRIDT